jgi:Asp-tRNA(Asn)/Glu-tRNA(Gln) amidotransferase A subunit family amidase
MVRAWTSSISVAEPSPCPSTSRSRPPSSSPPRSRKKKIGCLELLDLYLSRVEAYNPSSTPSSRWTSRAPQARQGGRRALVKAGKKLGPLHGVPMTIKESFDVAGMPTTWGDPAFKDNKSRRRIRWSSA